MSVQEITQSAGSASQWTCACGQEYRVSVARGELRFWPRNSNEGYCRQGLPEAVGCVRCGLPVQLPPNPAA